ncbi:hypothetical protein L484_025199 [Morus notabilis]|uniref:Uncharacterized protein n=1 Tax=Morus notabilis TaxID=981085 RepID=W9S4R6_9ROSA|nr:hypothetical protein L484_025199 [Morus notabilis]
MDESLSSHVEHKPPGVWNRIDLLHSTIDFCNISTDLESDESELEILLRQWKRNRSPTSFERKAGSCRIVILYPPEVKLPVVKGIELQAVGIEKDYPTRGRVSSYRTPKLISILAYCYTGAREGISMKPSKECRSETNSITLDPNLTCVRGLARIPFAGSEPSLIANLPPRNSYYRASSCDSSKTKSISFGID